MPQEFESSTGGPGPIPFRRLMSLKETGPNTFESLVGAFPPASRANIRAFGGHVYAQAVYAASKTLPRKGFVVHNVTGHFILPGQVDVPFVYKVRKVRDGGSYCWRQVDVYQDSDAGAHATSPCFISTISFKLEESDPKKFMLFEHQNAPKDHVDRTYRSVLEGIRPEDHPESPSADVNWFTEDPNEYGKPQVKSLPGLQMRKVDMKKFNGEVEAGGGRDAEGTSRWRQLCFYRLIPEKEEESEEDLNLCAAAHMYASDRNSLFLVQRAMGMADVVTPMGSLSHTVVFRGSPRHLKLTDDKGHPKWFVQEAWTSNSGENRGCHESRLWDYDNGRIIATTVQDGMVRFPRSPGESETKTKL